MVFLSKKNRKGYKIIKKVYIYVFVFIFSGHISAKNIRYGLLYCFDSLEVKKRPNKNCASILLSGEKKNLSSFFSRGNIYFLEVKDFLLLFYFTIELE